MASGRRVEQRPDCHTFLCKFWHFQMAVSQWKLAWLTPKLGILWILVCSFWLCESIVANPIITDSYLVLHGLKPGNSADVTMEILSPSLIGCYSYWTDQTPSGTFYETSTSWTMQTIHTNQPLPQDNGKEVADKPTENAAFSCAFRLQAKFLEQLKLVDVSFHCGP